MRLNIPRGEGSVPGRRSAAVALVGLAVAAVAHSAAGAAPAAPLPGYRLATLWPASSHGLPSPNSIAAANDGLIWLLDGPSGVAVALAPDGTLAERRAVPKDALDLSPIPGGGLVLGRWNPRPPPGEHIANVGRYDRAGQPVWVRQCDCASGTGVAVTQGRVWLTEPQRGTMTWLGSQDGRPRGQLAPAAARTGFPADIASAPQGLVVGTDLIGGAVFAWPAPYLPNDYVAWPVPESSGPFRIAAGAQGDGALVVAVLHSDGLIRVHRPDGTLAARFTVPGEPTDLTVGPAARIYVLDRASAAIRVYEPGAPPTPTPVPPDPPLVPGSCTITGTRSITPSRLVSCGTTQVEITLRADCPPDAVVGADVVLLIDESQSMRKGQPTSQMDAAKEAAHRFLAGLDLQHHLAAVVGFSDTATVIQPLTDDSSALDAAVDSLAPQGGGTNLSAALRVAMEHIGAAGRADALPTLLVLTDGEPNRPLAPEPDTAALVAAERARSRRAYIVTIGLGRFIDSLLLESMASSPRDFYYSPTVLDLNRIYDTILRVIQGLGPTDLVIEDTPAQPFVRHVPGRGRPPPLVVNERLTWARPVLPAGGIVITHTLKVGHAGRSPIGPARALYTDADGTRRAYHFPEPVLEVNLPAPTPPSVGPATPVPTVPPDPPLQSCSAADARFIHIEVFPDTVGRGGYACPGCNGVFDGGDVWSTVGKPVGPATVQVAGADGSPLWVGEVRMASAGPGRRLVRMCAPPPYTVSLLRAPPGYVTCPNSPGVRVVSDRAFGPGRHAAVRYALWSGCRRPAASPLPAPATCP